jgi:bifunctional DNase/RNase
MTHDLFKTVLDDLDASLERIVVTELRDRTFYAELRLEGPNGERIVSSRPSDAIALAVRTGAKIFATEEVLADAGYVEEPASDADADNGDDPDQVVADFREFIDQVNPEDFAS